MKVSELIESLEQLLEIHGDQDVFLDVNEDGLIEVGEVDVDIDDTGIIIWKGEKHIETIVCPRCDQEYEVGGCNECPYCGHQFEEASHAA